MRKYTFAFSLLMAFVLLPVCSAQGSAGPGSPAMGPGRGGGDKRPMTFEDMMKMKRLGETAVSPDGSGWLTRLHGESGAEHQDGGVVGAGDCGRRAA